MHRAFVIEKAKEHQFTGLIFKSSNEKNWSLTEGGFEFMRDVLQLKPFVIEKMKELFVTKTITALHKTFQAPYYFHTKTYSIYHYDEEVQNYFMIYRDKFPVYLEGFNE